MPQSGEQTFGAPALDVRASEKRPGEDKDGAGGPCKCGPMACRGQWPFPAHRITPSSTSARWIVQ
jgi:hypothetical protein